MILGICNWKLLLYLVIFAGGFAIYFQKPIRTQLFRPWSPKFPYPPKDFVGRDDDVQKVVELLSNSSIEIVCIVGSPGIGKSALAKYVGNEMILYGTVVHYVNMADLPERSLKQGLAEKIDQGLRSTENVTFDDLLVWAARNQYWKRLIVLDNCDECIHTQSQQFQEAIHEILDFSSNIKFLTTSRETMYYLESYREHNLGQLSRDSACQLLEEKVPKILNKTEKEFIAELTGDIPLALKIIGSLFSPRLKPTPGHIINELRQRPISILSPKTFSPMLQLNHSINLSYNYLSKRLKKVAHYTSHFPGSFAVSAAVEILKRFSLTASENSIHRALNELVMRSLLEYNEDTERYYFHKLVKDFFLLHSDFFEGKRFNISFQFHFTTVLCDMTASFVLTNPLAELALLDTERHNVEYLFDVIRHSRHIKMNRLYGPVVGPILGSAFDSLYEANMGCFAKAIDQYLGYRFSPEELIPPVQTAVDIFRARLNHNATAGSFTVFVDLTISLASLIESTKGAEDTVQLLINSVDTIEEFGHISSDCDQAYTSFYTKILNYESLLSKMSALLYLLRVLEKTERSSIKCITTENCDYYSIAVTLINIGDYNKSIHFLEKASKGNHSVIRTLEIFLVLYKFTTDETKRKEFSGKLIEVYPQVMNQTSSVICANLGLYYTNYGNFLKSAFESSKYTQLQERVINALLELGKNSDIDMDIVSVFRMARQLHNENKFSRAVKVASFALDHLKYGDNQDAVIGLHMIISKSLYSLPNTTGASKFFIKTMDYLYANNLASTRETDVMECCSYLISLGSFSYLNKCSMGYSKKSLQVIAQIIVYPFVAVFAVPLDPVTNPEPPEEKTTNVKRSWHKKTARTAAVALHYSSNEGYMSKFVNVTSDKASQLLNSRVFRVLERVISVFFRLCITYYCLQCICYWFSVTCTTLYLCDYSFIDFYIYFYVKYSTHNMLFFFNINYLFVIVDISVLDSHSCNFCCTLSLFYNIQQYYSHYCSVTSNSYPCQIFVEICVRIKVHHNCTVVYSSWFD